MKKVYVLVQESEYNRCVSVFDTKEKATEALNKGYQDVVSDSTVSVNETSIDDKSYCISTTDGNTEFAYIKEVVLNNSNNDWFII
jgi:hypothetical protein